MWSEGRKGSWMTGKLVSRIDDPKVVELIRAFVIDDILWRGTVDIHTQDYARFLIEEGEGGVWLKVIANGNLEYPAALARESLRWLLVEKGWSYEHNDERE